MSSLFHVLILRTDWATFIRVSISTWDSLRYWYVKCVSHIFMWDYTLCLAVRPYTFSPQLLLSELHLVAKYDLCSLDLLSLLLQLWISMYCHSLNAVHICLSVVKQKHIRRNEGYLELCVLYERSYMKCFCIKEEEYHSPTCRLLCYEHGSTVRCSDDVSIWGYTSSCTDSGWAHNSHNDPFLF